MPKSLLPMASQGRRGSRGQLRPTRSPALLRRFAAAKLSPPRANQIGVERARPLSTTQLTDALLQHSRPRGLAASLRGIVGLSDAVIHHQDIRRPLGRPRTIPPERLRAVLDYLRFAPLMRGPWRVHGLSLEATDIDWHSGRGAPLRGTGRHSSWRSPAAPTRWPISQAPAKTSSPNESDGLPTGGRWIKSEIRRHTGGHRVRRPVTPARPRAIGHELRSHENVDSQV